jgi:hypothetical protein
VSEGAGQLAIRVGLSKQGIGLGLERLYGIGPPVINQTFLSGMGHSPLND